MRQFIIATSTSSVPLYFVNVGRSFVSLALVCGTMLPVFLWYEPARRRLRFLGTRNQIAEDGQPKVHVKRRSPHSLLAQSW